MHIHVNHFQIVSYSDRGSGINTSDYFLPGQWRDTVPVFDGELVVRFKPTDFVGETIIHCHFLRHEDIGMMDSFLIQLNSVHHAGSAQAATNFIEIIGILAIIGVILLIGICTFHRYILLIVFTILSF